MKSGIPELFKLFTISDLANNDKEKAEVLSSSFNSVYIEEPLGEIPTMEDIDVKFPLVDLYIPADQVSKKLSKLVTNKACGPEELHLKLLENLATDLSLSLSMIMNESLLVGQVPDDWKRANVSALY